METGHDIVSASSIDSARTGAGKAAIYERFMANATHRGGPAATTPPSSGRVSTKRGAVGIDRQAKSGDEERWRRGWTNYTESGEGQLYRGLAFVVTNSDSVAACTYPVLLLLVPPNPLQQSLTTNPTSFIKITDGN